MHYEFLQQFPRRMKNVGLYAELFALCSQKSIWKQDGFDRNDEQLNMVFAVMLFIMEQSLKEEVCTIDDISAYVDDINSQYFRKPLSYDDCRELAIFIVNVVLSNEGRTMFFNGYDFDEMRYKEINISYIANRIVYVDQEVRRTSYYMTDDGYNLLLGTLEIESNMKLTIQEMIFKMHLEKQSYDKALDDIKNIFNMMRIQIQKIREAMTRIRRNVLDYNIAEYQNILNENLGTIDSTKEKFTGYRQNVQTRVKEINEEAINIGELKSEEEDKLKNLREIDRYLNRAIDEYQKILNGHFDLKSMYEKELDKMSDMALVRRFDLRTELFDKVMDQPSMLQDINLFLSPLFNKDPDKILSPIKLCAQQTVRTEEIEDSVSEEDFDEENWKREQERLLKERLELYEKSLTYILDKAQDSGVVTLSELSKEVSEDEEKKNMLIPEIGVFKEIMVELLKAGNIDVLALKKEKADFIQEEQTGFQMNEMILKIIDKHGYWRNIDRISIARTGGEPVLFSGIREEEHDRSIRCSDVRITIVSK